MMTFGLWEEGEGVSCLPRSSLAGQTTTQIPNKLLRDRVDGGRSY